MYVSRVLAQINGDQLEAQEGRNCAFRAQIQRKLVRMPKGAERERSRRDQGAILSNGKNHIITQEGELQVI